MKNLNGCSTGKLEQISISNTCIFVLDGLNQLQSIDKTCSRIGLNIIPRRMKQKKTSGREAVPALAACFNSISNLKLPLAPPHLGHSLMFLS
jgi:hypothetical protein